MRALLVQPEFPPTYWSYSYALRFVGKKCVHPPLGLITVAALLPSHWRPEVVDLNVETLSDRRLLSTDVVMLTGLHVRRRGPRRGGRGRQRNPGAAPPRGRGLPGPRRGRGHDRRLLRGARGRPCA